MLRAILSVLVGYVVMAVVVMVTLSIAWWLGGTSFAFEEGTTRATFGWSLVALACGAVAAVAGGRVARSIATTPKPVKVLAGIVLVLGLVIAVGHLRVDDPRGAEALAERPIEELTMFEASAETVAPAWYNFLIPLVGAAGVLYGGRVASKSARG